MTAVAETHPFAPNWCLAPSETLKDWLSENGMSARVLSVACGGKQNKPAALALITDVLERKPLTEVHAACLARGTQVPARFWLALEQGYRAGLAAGLIDASDDLTGECLRRGPRCPRRGHRGTTGRPAQATCTGIQHKPNGRTAR